MALFDLTEYVQDVIQPSLPARMRDVKRTDDRKGLGGYSGALRPYRACVNCFNRRRTVRHGARILQALS